MTTFVRKRRGELSEVVLQIDHVRERDHFVQFYKEDSTVVDCVARFFAAGFAQGNAGLLIATPERREAIEVKLNALKVDVVALRDEGGFPVFDAREMLSKL